MSNYYVTCQNCGANLDPGEHCDCERSSETIRAAPVLSLAIAAQWEGIDNELIRVFRMECENSDYS